MVETIRALPKCELHVHLEGSLQPETLMELDSSLSREEIGRRYSYTNFEEFLQAYKWVNGFLRRPEDFALALRHLVERQRDQGCVEAEVNLSIGVLLWRRLPFGEFFAAIEEEASRLPIPVRFIFDAVRQFGIAAAEAVADHAIACRQRGVVGFGIGGYEAAMPLTAYRELAERVTAAGIRFVPHAGETTSARDVWDALECGAARIGHGIRAIEDPVLVQALAGGGVPLEISISSNVATGAVDSLAAHPVRRLFDAGVPLVLNTDDPPMFQCTLLGEYELAATRFGFSEAELRQLAGNSLRYAFNS
jgi:adenosine deaminase/aminodeoxyfutalosine deaminase